MTRDLSDIEIDAICAGLRQNSAKVRYLRSLGLNVDRKPNGRPLVNAAHYDAVRGGSAHRGELPGITAGAIQWSVR